MFRNPRIAAAAPMIIDISAPVLSFVLLHTIIGLSPIIALTVGALVAGVRTLYRTIRERRVNAFSGMMLVLLATTLLLVLVTGDPRLVLAKSAVVPFLGGVYGIVTNYVGRALVFDVVAPFVTRGDPDRTRRWEAGWENATFRKRVRLINLVWAIGFITSAVIRVVVIYSLPLDIAVFAGQVPTLLSLVILLSVTRVLARPLVVGLRDPGETPARADSVDTRRAVTVVD